MRMNAIMPWKEESSQSDLHIVKYLEQQEVDVRSWGKDELYVLHFFHVEPGPHIFPVGVVPDRWIHHEY
jgi:hypothetical protein